mmetsp:Transcript_13415/g.39628  ORF Transcript_13415/g.39628 Transcript_13415/m.39628 type:complete len:358 (+) Transcript_13415:579-1652(+)
MSSPPSPVPFSASRAVAPISALISDTLKPTSTAADSASTLTDSRTDASKPPSPTCDRSSVPSVDTGSSTASFVRLSSPLTPASTRVTFTSPSFGSRPLYTAIAPEVCTAPSPSSRRSSPDAPNGPSTPTTWSRAKSSSASSSLCRQSMWSAGTCSGGGGGGKPSAGDVSSCASLLTCCERTTSFIVRSAKLCCNTDSSAGTLASCGAATPPVPRGGASTSPPTGWASVPRGAVATVVGSGMAMRDGGPPSIWVRGAAAAAAAAAAMPLVGAAPLQVAEADAMEAQPAAMEAARAVAGSSVGADLRRAFGLRPASSTELHPGRCDAHTKLSGCSTPSTVIARTRSVVIGPALSPLWST